MNCTSVRYLSNFEFQEKSAKINSGRRWKSHGALISDMISGSRPVYPPGGEIFLVLSPRSVSRALRLGVLKRRSYLCFHTCWSERGTPEHVAHRSLKPTLLRPCIRRSNVGRQRAASWNVSFRFFIGVNDAPCLVLVHFGCTFRRSLAKLSGCSWIFAKNFINSATRPDRNVNFM